MLEGYQQDFNKNETKDTFSTCQGSWELLPSWQCRNSNVNLLQNNLTWTDKKLLSRESLLMSNATRMHLPPVCGTRIDTDEGGLPVTKLPLTFEALHGLKRLSLLWCWYSLPVRPLGCKLEPLVQKFWWREPITAALWADIFPPSVCKFSCKEQRTQFWEMNFLQICTCIHLCVNTCIHTSISTPMHPSINSTI